jgi:hypothetical protein
MNKAVEPVVHRARVNAFQQEATWRLGPDALERDGGEPAAAPVWAQLARFVVRLIVPWALDPIERGGAARFPYAEVRDLRLRFDPTRFDKARHRCDLRLADGRRAHVFSTHFVGVADFEDRAATYVPLVYGLVARIAAASPRCRFRSGKSRLAYWAEHIFLLAVTALLVFVLFLVGGQGISELAWLKLAIVISFIPVLIAYTRKNWPRRFEPAAIPADALPDIPAPQDGAVGR